MKTYIFLFSLTYFSLEEVKAQTEFVLEPTQSMIMTGKGPGQDATYNPFYGQECFALIENNGEREFSIRVQKEGKILEEFTILVNESKKVKLLPGDELYFDSNPDGIARASISYEITSHKEKVNWWLWTASWNAKNKVLAVGGTQDTLRLFSTERNELAKNIPLLGTITSTTWHPSKKILAVSMQNENSNSFILDLVSMEQILLDSIDETGARAISWNNTGKLISVGDYSGILTIYNENGHIIKRVNTKQKGLLAVDWHPEKNIVVAVGEWISIYDLDQDSVYNVKPREEDVLMLCVEWHPNGKIFATGDYGDFENNHPPFLQYWSANGQNLMTIAKSQSEIRNLSWSSDGKTLVTASESLRLWNENGDLLIETKSENLLWGIDWNDLNDNIVTTDDKGRIIIWDRELNKIQELTY